MKKIYTSVWLIMVGLTVIGCKQAPYEFTTSETKRIISYLASDEMNGRHTLSQEINQAATFIAEEFKVAGLVPLDGDNDFFQEFNLINTSVGSSLVLINEDTVSSDNIMVMSSSPEIVFSGDASSVSVISAEDDFRAKFGNLRRGEGSQIVLVDTAHTNFFKRYSQYFKTSSTVEGQESANSVVMILTEQAEITSVNVNIQMKIEKLPIKNVAGRIEGKRSNEIVLFSGHYDHIGINKAVDGDSISNGANDDASGTTAVIELAKYFKSLGTPERTLMFVAFTGEEVGGYGSTYFSKQLNPDEIVAMFNIEMIGKPAVSGPNSAWITGFERSDFGEMLQKSAEGSGYEFYADPYPDQNLFYRSDNATLARLGVPAHSISTTPIDVDQDYHQVSDEVETLDLDHLTNTIRAISVGAKQIVEGTLTPKRVDVNEID